MKLLIIVTLFAAIAAVSAACPATPTPLPLQPPACTNGVSTQCIRGAAEGAVSVYDLVSAANVTGCDTPLFARTSTSGVCDAFGRSRACHVNTTLAQPLPLVPYARHYSFSESDCSVPANAVFVDVFYSASCVPFDASETQLSRFRKIDCTNPASPVERVFSNAQCTQAVSNATYTQGTCANGRIIMCSTAAADELSAGVVVSVSWLLLSMLALALMMIQLN